MDREISAEEIYEWVVAFMAEHSCKRFEENVKFVFKLAFKHLKFNFQQSNLDSQQPQSTDLAFYKFYFEELSKKWQLPLSEFYDPLNNKTRHKTLTGEYMKLVFASEKFRTHFKSYLLSGQLKSDYQAGVPNKILKLLKRFDKCFDSRDLSNNTSVIGSMRRYFRTNKQCKLPWTDMEITSAVETLAQLCK